MTTPPRNPPPAGRPHVLVVTSDPDLEAFLRESLVFGGCWVSHIASGLQVLEVFRLRTFDLALIDATLSGLDAVELVRRLHHPSAGLGPARTDIPIVLIADAPEATRDNAAIAAGVDDVLTPPIDADTLIALVFARVTVWRAIHPDRPWSDALALS